MDEKLKAIVQRMIDAGESEANIAKVIKAYVSSKPVKKKGEPVVSDGTSEGTGTSLVSEKPVSSAPGVSLDSQDNRYNFLNREAPSFDFSSLKSAAKEKELKESQQAEATSYTETQALLDLLKSTSKEFSGQRAKAPVSIQGNAYIPGQVTDASGITDKNPTYPVQQIYNFGQGNANAPSGAYQTPQAMAYNKKSIKEARDRIVEFNALRDGQLSQIPAGDTKNTAEVNSFWDNKIKKERDVINSGYSPIGVKMSLSGADPKSENVTTEELIVDFLPNFLPQGSQKFNVPLHDPETGELITDPKKYKEQHEGEETDWEKAFIKTQLKNLNNIVEKDMNRWAYSQGGEMTELELKDMKSVQKFASDLLNNKSLSNFSKSKLIRAELDRLQSKMRESAIDKQLTSEASAQNKDVSDIMYDKKKDFKENNVYTQYLPEDMKQLTDDVWNQTSQMRDFMEQYYDPSGRRGFTIINGELDMSTVPMKERDYIESTAKDYMNVYRNIMTLKYSEYEDGILEKRILARDIDNKIDDLKKNLSMLPKGSVDRDKYQSIINSSVKTRDGIRAEIAEKEKWRSSVFLTEPKNLTDGLSGEMNNSSSARAAFGSNPAGESPLRSFEKNFLKLKQTTDDMRLSGDFDASYLDRQGQRAREWVDLESLGLSLSSKEKEYLANRRILTALSPIFLNNNLGLTAKSGGFLESLRNGMSSFITSESSETSTETKIAGDQLKYLSSQGFQAENFNDEKILNKIENRLDVPWNSMESAGEMTGVVSAVILDLAVSNVLIANPALSSASKIKKIAQLGKVYDASMDATRVGRFLKPLISESVKAEIAGNFIGSSEEELNFKSFFIGGGVGKVMQKTLSKLPINKLTEWTVGVFGGNGDKAMNLMSKIGEANSRGLGEVAEEFTQELVQVYNLELGERGFWEEVENRFGTFNGNMKFVVSSYMMGAGFAFTGSKKAKESYNKLSTEEKKIVDLLNSEVTGDVSLSSEKVVEEANKESVKANAVNNTTTNDQILEGIGEDVMESVDVLGKYAKTKNVNILTEKDFDFLKNISGDKNMVDIITANIKAKMSTGQMSKKEGQELADNFTETVEDFSRIKELFRPKEGQDQSLTLIQSIQETASQAQDLNDGGFYDQEGAAITFERLSAIATDPILNQLYQADLQRQVNEGAITETQAILQNGEIQRISGISNQIPDMVQGDLRMTADKLIREQDKINESIKGKNPDLVIAEKTRLKEISKELQELSKADIVDEVTNASEVERLRQEEQAELIEAIPNAENYLTDGKVDKEKITNPEDIAEFEKIYDKYDKVISPLLKPTQQTSEVEAKEVQVISAENSSNFSNMTEDGDGNFVFYHYSTDPRETIDPKKYGSNKANLTSKAEKQAIAKVGGVSMFYTNKDTAEKGTGDYGHMVKIPKGKVYDMNNDYLNLKEQAKELHDKEHPGMGYDDNSEAAYVTKIAEQKGFEMLVAEWKGVTRAQTVTEKVPTQRSETKGDQIKKSFDNDYESNKQKGYAPVIPEGKKTKLDRIYKKINVIKNEAKEYDSLYRLNENSTKLSEAEITPMIMDSNLDQSIKDEYQEAVKYKPDPRRSVKKENIVSVHNENGGSSISQSGENLFGKPGYSVSTHTDKTTKVKGKNITQEDIDTYTKKYKGTLEKNKVLFVGTWYDTKTDTTYIDVVSHEKDLKTAIAMGIAANQKSIFDLENGVEIDTGGTGEVTNESETETKTAKKGADILESAFNETADSTEVMDQVENAKKAIAKVSPKTKIVVHKTAADYKKSGKNRKQNEGGEYDVENDTIHINLESANKRTVAHEVFHALLLSKGMSNKKAEAITNKMLDVVKKTASPELLQTLEEFSSRYESTLQSEESIAELFGILASEYETLPRPTQNLIKRWLDKLAKLFGLKTFTDNEIVDMLNVVSAKVKEGIEISEKELKTIRKKWKGGKSTDNPSDGISRKQVGDFDVQYTEQNRLDELLKEGLITQPKDVSQFEGQMTTITSPDDMLAGSISIGGDIIFEGGGGVFFVTKYGDVWASGKIGTANTIANSINKSLKKNGGNGYLTLTKGSDTKLISSASGVNSSMAVLGSMIDKGLISASDFRRAVSESIKKHGGQIRLTGDALTLKEQVNEYFSDPKTTTFQRRGDVMRDILGSLSQSQSIKNNNDAIVSMLGGNPDKKIAKKDGIKSQGLTELVAGVASEQLTKGLSTGDVYAVIEVNSEVEVVEDSHPSYPFHIRVKDGSKPVLHLLQNRENGRETLKTSTGKEYKVGNVSVLTGSFNESINRKQLPADDLTSIRKQKPEGTPSIADVRAKAKEMGVDEDGVVAYLKRLGYTTAEINSEANSLRKKAVDDAKAKYDLSVKKRGNNHSDGVSAALGDLKKSEWYKNSTDIQRDQAVIDIKKFFGEKIKKAPSVKKLGLVPASKKITVSEKAALKTQIKLRAKAARDGAISEKKARQEIADMVKVEMELTKGKFSKRQVAAIVRRALRMNLSNDKQAGIFVDYVAKVVSDVDYLDKISKAKAIQKKISKNANKADLQSNLSVMGREFAKINPRMVKDIDQYNEMASKVNDSLMSSKRKGEEVIVRVTANQEEVTAYTDKMISKQEDLIKESLIQDYAELTDANVLTKDMSIAEMNDAIADILDSEVKPKIDVVKLRDNVKDKFTEFSEEAQEILDSGIDPITGEDLSLSKAQRDAVQTILNLNTDKLSVKELLGLIDMLTNFAVNRSTSKIIAIAKMYEGAENLDKALNKIPPATKRWRITRSYINNFGSISLLLENILGGPGNAIVFKRLSGFSEFSYGAIKGENASDTIEQNYIKEFKKKKANGEYFNTEKNTYERGMYAFLMRNKIGDSVDMRKEFNRRVELMKENIDYMTKEGTDEEQAQGAIYQQIAEKFGLFDQDVTMEDIDSRVDKVNKEAVGWWISEWENRKTEADAVAKDIYNRVLDSDINFTPDVFRTKGQVTMTEEQRMMERMADKRGKVYDKSAPSLMATSKPRILPPSMKIDLDFDNNNANRIKSSLIDIETAAATQKLKGFLESKNLSKLFPNKKDRDTIVEVIKNYIDDKRIGKKFVKKDETIKWIEEKILNPASNAGVKLVLASLQQIPKQSISVIANTILNTGRFDAGAMFSSTVKQWIKDNGMPLSKRGVESTSTIERADKYMKKYGGTRAEALQLLKKADDFYLKTFLLSTDVRVAQASFLSYYKKDLLRQGLRNVWGKADINYDAPMNEEAMDYAMQMVDKQQNISDPDMAGSFWNSQNTGTNFLKRTMFALASFSMNQHVRMYTDIKTITKKTQSGDQRVAAAKSLAGTAAEFYVYRALALSLGYAIKDWVNELVGYDELEDQYITKAVKKENNHRKLNGKPPMNDKQELKFRQNELKKNREKKYNQSILTAATKDFVSPMPFLDGTSIDIVNYFMEKSSDPYSKEINQDVNDENLKRKKPMNRKEEEAFRSEKLQEEAFQLYSMSGTDSWGNELGTAGIVIDKMIEGSDIYKASNTGVIEDYAGRKKYLLPKHQEAMKTVNKFNVGYFLRILPADIGTVTNNSYKKLRNMSFTKTEMDQYEILFRNMYYKKTNIPLELGSDKLKEKIKANPDLINLEAEKMLRSGVKANKTFMKVYGN